MASVLAAGAAAWAAVANAGLSASVAAAISLLSGSIAVLAGRLASTRVVVLLSPEQLIVETRRWSREQFRVIRAAEVTGVPVRHSLLPQFGLYAGLQLVWIVSVTSSASPKSVELWIDDNEERARSRADSIAHTLQLRPRDAGSATRTARAPQHLPMPAQSFTIRTRQIGDAILRMAAAGTVGGLVFLALIVRDGADRVGLAALFGALVSTACIAVVVVRILAATDERLTVQTEHLHVEQSGKPIWLARIDGNLSFRKLSWMEEQGPGIRIRAGNATRVVGSRVGKRQLADLVRWLESSTGIAVLRTDQ